MNVRFTVGKTGLNRATYTCYEGHSKSFQPGCLPMYFWTENFTDFSNKFLLVFSKNFMSSACLLYEIQFIAFSWLHCMSNFNEINVLPKVDRGARTFA